MTLEEGQNVLCTVKEISGTTVFVNIDNNGEGTIVFSEIAPGRIRNIRDYVIPGKKIVCKILEIDSKDVRLSLRRVSEKEKREVLEKYEKEKTSLSILRSIVKEKAEQIATKISEKEESLYDFFQNCKSAPEKLEKYLSSDEAVKICKILSERKEKQIEVKKEFALSSNQNLGIIIIKKLLQPYKDKITYLAAGRFLIKITGEDYKKANQEMVKVLQEIEKNAKKEKAEFSVKEK